MLKPLRVLHVTGAMNVGGTETMLMNIYRNIDKSKIQFDFVSYSDQDAYYDDEIKSLGGRLIKLKQTTSVWSIFKAIREYGPYDAIHSHTLFHCGIANIAAKLAGVKVRISHAHTTLDRNDDIFRKMYIRFMRAIIKLYSTNLMACSNGAGRYLFGKTNFIYFPNLIDYSKFLSYPYDKVISFKKEQGLHKSIVIGHVGRFIEAKNHRFMLELMKYIVMKDINAKLLLVGDGYLRIEIEEQAKAEGIYDNIRFVGIREDIPIMLHSMDVFVFPSIHEGLGLALLEAQACGVPCVISEAIQPEADLNMGLVSKLHLADGPEVWANKISEVAKRKETNTDNIISSLDKSGYSLSEGISKLMNIYKSGSRYEENSNCLL